MTEYTIHRPDFIGTTTNDWEFPTEQDFDTDDLSEVGRRFLLSSSSFDDPDDYDDFELPVVNSQGYLSLNGLWAARQGPYSVERIGDIDVETVAEVRRLIDDLGVENFEEFKDINVTDADWAAATGNEPPNPLGGIVSDLIGPAESSYSPRGAAVGLAFLAALAAVLAWYRDRD